MDTSGFCASLVASIVWDLLKSGKAITMKLLKEKLSKWLIDDKVISEISDSIVKAPQFCVDSEEKIKIYLEMNPNLMTYFKSMTGQNNTYSMIQQKTRDVSGVVAGIINGTVTQYTNSEKPRPATIGPFSVIQDCRLKHRNIQIVKSYSYNRGDLESGLDANGQPFILSTFTVPSSQKNLIGFVMTLFSFVPPENWSELASHGNGMEFEVIASPGITSIQFQIKDSAQKQFVDMSLKLVNGKVCFLSKLKELAPVDSWKDVGEVCFTVFTENCSIYEHPLNYKIGIFNILPM